MESAFISYSLYIDKIFAIREFSLNSLMEINPGFYWRYWAGGGEVPNSIYYPDYTIFSLSFTDSPYIAPGFGCVKPNANIVIEELRIWT